MAELTTEQLLCMLTSLVTNCDSVSVLGVYPADCIPLRLCDVDGEPTMCLTADNSKVVDSMHYCFILNTHPHGQPGEHWLAFFYNHITQNLEYFDSFGMPLTRFVHVKSALEKCNLIMSTRPVNNYGMLQSRDSSVCGHYCIMYLYWRAKNYSKSSAIFNISVLVRGSPAQRDKYIVQHLRALLIQHSCVYDTAARGAMSQSCTCCRI